MQRSQPGGEIAKPHSQPRLALGVLQKTSISTAKRRQTALVIDSTPVQLICAARGLPRTESHLI